MPDNARSPDRRLLVINPNSNAGVTRRIAEHVLAGLPEANSVEVVNPETGPFSIETPADRACAVPIVLDLIRERPGYDGYVLACFDDLAVEEARGIVDAPVVSMAQAAIEAAAGTGRRYTVVTTVGDQVPAIEGLLAKYDASGLGTVRACRIGVAEAAARTGRAESLLDGQIRAAVGEDGAGLVVLGSGAYAGRASDFGKKYGVHFIEGLPIAIKRLALNPQDRERETGKTSILSRRDALSSR